MNGVSIQLFFDLFDCVVKIMSVLVNYILKVITTNRSLQILTLNF